MSDHVRFACLLLSVLAIEPALACQRECNMLPAMQLGAVEDLSAVALGDLNDDGLADIAAAGEDYMVRVYLQQPGRKWSPSTPWGKTDAPPWVMPHSIGIGDLNGDGRKDIVVTASGPAPGLRVLLQDASGGFTSIHDYATSTDYKLRLADFDGDGRLDVAAIGWDEGVLNVFRQSASGLLEAPRSYPVGYGGWNDLEAGDVNGDGRLDVVVMSGQYYAYPNFSVLLNDGAGGFHPAVAYDVPGSSNASGLGVGDVTGDGYADVVIADSWQTMIAVFAQQNGVLAAPVTYPSGADGSRPNAVEIADFDQDGRNDVVVLADYGTLYVHLQDEAGRLLAATKHVSGYGVSNPDAHSIAVADLDADGKPDVVTGASAFMTGVNVHYGTRASLRVTLAAERDVALVDQPTRYTATLVNEGPDVAREVRLDLLLANGTFRDGYLANSQGTCEKDYERWCALGALAVGQSATVTFYAYAHTDPGVYTHAVAASALTYSGRAAALQPAVSTIVTESADLVIDSHTVSAPASGRVRFNVNISNDGARDAPDVRYEGLAPENFAVASATWTELWGGTRSGTCDVSGRSVTCALGLMPVTDIWTGKYPVAVRIEGQPLTGTTLLNRATVTNGLGDPNTRNSTSERLATAAGAAINQPPVLDAGGPYVVRLGASAVLDASRTVDPEGGWVDYQWQLPGREAWGARARHTFTTLGPVAVQVTASDRDGGSSSADPGVTVVNAAPVAQIRSPYALIRKESSALFDGALSYDVDGSGLTYAWDFGDGTGASGASVSHQYARSGAYPVTLTVSDGAASATATATAHVLNLAPVAEAGGPYSVAKNKPLTLDGGRSMDANGDPLTFAWSLGDGATSTAMRPVHTYTRGGTYTARLVVNDGEVDSAPDTATVTVVNQAPVANGGGPYSGIKGQPITFDGSASSDADNDPLTWRWTFGDGTTGTGVQPTHTYAKGGRYTLKLVVNDGEVDSAVYQTTVEVKSR